MDKSDVTLERMRSFVRVVERGSLSAVARELNTGQSTITRHLRELEQAVGVVLLNRTTRRVALTGEGSRYYAHCVQILRLVDQAADEIRDDSAAPSGTVRLSCTAALGVLHVTRLIFAFQARHQAIRVDLSLTDERVDLVREGIDIALRLGPLADSSMTQHHLGHSTRLLVAAPAYLAAHGRPAAPEDLAGHNVVRMANVAGSDTLTITTPGGRTCTVPVTGDLRVDHGLAAREAFRAGRGIGPTHRWLVDDLLASGDLVPLLPDHTLATTPLNMLTLPDRARLARVRLLIDDLADQVRRLPGIVRAGAAAGM